MGGAVMLGIGEFDCMVDFGLKRTPRRAEPPKAIP
jgi:hypothetical protein